MSVQSFGRRQFSGSSLLDAFEAISMQRGHLANYPRPNWNMQGLSLGVAQRISGLIIRNRVHKVIDRGFIGRGFHHCGIPTSNVFVRWTRMRFYARENVKIPALQSFVRSRCSRKTKGQFRSPYHSSYDAKDLCRCKAKDGIHRLNNRGGTKQNDQKISPTIQTIEPAAHSCVVERISQYIETDLIKIAFCGHSQSLSNPYRGGGEGAGGWGAGRGPIGCPFGPEPTASCCRQHFISRPLCTAFSYFCSPGVDGGGGAGRGPNVRVSVPDAAVLGAGRGPIEFIATRSVVGAGRGPIENSTVPSSSLSTFIICSVCFFTRGGSEAARWNRAASNSNTMNSDFLERAA